MTNLRSIRAIIAVAAIGLATSAPAASLDVSRFQGDQTFVGLCNQGAGNQDCEFAVGELRGGDAGKRATWEYGLQNPPGRPAATGNFGWVSGRTESFALSYDALTGGLSLELGGGSVRTTLPGTGLAGMETLFIRARSEDADNRIELSNLTLGGHAIGDLDYLGGGSAGAGYLRVSGVDFAGDWTLGGDVTATWTGDRIPKNSRLDVGFKLTDVAAPSAVPLPAAVWLMIAGLGGLFGLRRTGRAA